MRGGKETDGAELSTVGDHLFHDLQEPDLYYRAGTRDRSSDAGTDNLAVTAWR